MSELIESYDDVVSDIEEAVEADDPVRASTHLQKLERLIQNERPDQEDDDGPNHHRSDVRWDDKSRAEEFIGAIELALEHYRDDPDDEMWLHTAWAETNGFRTVVLDQTLEELGWEPVDEDDGEA